LTPYDDLDFRRSLEIPIFSTATRSFDSMVDLNWCSLMKIIQLKVFSRTRLLQSQLLLKRAQHAGMMPIQSRNMLR